jgi:excisionase family DNA binding protein
MQGVTPAHEVTMGERYLSRRQAAERYGVSERTLDRLIRDKTLTAYRPGGRRRVLLAVEELDKSMRPQAGAR